MKKKAIIFPTDDNCLINATHISHAFIVYTRGQNEKTETKRLFITKKPSSITSILKAFDEDYVTRVEKMDVMSVIVVEE